MTLPLLEPGEGSSSASSPSWELIFSPLLAQMIANARVPYACFGHGMGGLLVYEIARSLRDRSGLEPVHLFISGTGAPCEMRGIVKFSDYTDDVLISALLPTLHQRLLASKDRAFQQEVIRRLRFTTAFMDDYRYQPSELLTCPITVYGGFQDRLVRYQDLTRWQAYTRGTCKIQQFPGAHDYLSVMREMLLNAINTQLQPYMHTPIR